MGKSHLPGKSGVSEAPDSPPHGPPRRTVLLLFPGFKFLQAPSYSRMFLLGNLPFSSQKLGSQGQLRATSGAFTPGESVASGPTPPKPQ